MSTTGGLIARPLAATGREDDVETQSMLIRSRRVLTAALAVIAASFLVLFVPIIVFAFVLAFRAGGAPDQGAINAFAAAVSRAAMPWLARLLTLVFAFRLVRRDGDAGHAIDGLAVGALAGALNLAVTLAFGGRLDARALLFFGIVAGLGWVGGLLGRRLRRTDGQQDSA